LDAVYFSKGVLTGAGTFAREAAALGVPAVSCFAGSKLLSVDVSLINEKRLFYTRDPQSAVDYILNCPKPEGLPDLTRLKKVKKELIEKLSEVMSQLLK
jgi:predicted glycosyltransferase